MFARRISLILLAVLLPVLIVLFFGAALAEETAPEMLSLAIIPETAEPVPVGEAAVFKVVLDNMDGQNQPNMALELTWDTDAVRAARVELVQEETEKIGTQGVRRSEGAFHWRGGILADGRLTLRVTMLPNVCYDSDLPLTLNGRAGRQDGSGGQLTSEQTLLASCPVNNWTMQNVRITSLVDNLPPEGAFKASADVLQGLDLHKRLELTNDGDEPMNALVMDSFGPVEGQEANCLAAGDEIAIKTGGAATKRFDRGYLQPGLNGVQATDEFLAGFMILELMPGETWTADLRLPLRGRVPGCEFGGMVQVYPATAVPIPGSCDGGTPDCRYVGWTTQAQDLQRLFTILQPFDSNGVSARLVSPDLGDAPASENNFGDQPMTTYDGVAADFPTVYDLNFLPQPNGVAPEGVTADHREAPLISFASPIRLGDLSSFEREADLNPWRNINPPANQANLDLWDDGWLAGELPGSCSPFTGKVRVTIQEGAIDYLLEHEGIFYLNAWVDANGDGDWEDTTTCGGQLVAEHLFINVPVPIASLGAGQHEIELPANNGIQWATDATWLRLALSDEPMPLNLTTGDLQHGDGRGPAGGFRFGEVEDYRFRVGASKEAADAAGADLGLRLETDLGFMANHSPADLAGRFAIQATDCLTCIDDCYGGNSIVSLGNLGDVPAGRSTLVVMPDPALRADNAQIAIEADLSWTDEPPTTVACSAGDPDCRIEVELGEIPPRAFGQVLVYTSAECSEDSQACKKTAYTVEAMISSPDDEDNSNNSAEETTTLPLPPEWLEPPQLMSPIPGTTVGPEITVVAGGKAGRTVAAYVGGVRVASGDINNDGIAEFMVPSGIGEGEVGTIELSVGYDDIPGGKRNPTTPVEVTVDNRLLFDPSSLQFEDKVGSEELYAFHPWDESGRVDANGWLVPLQAGNDYGVTLGWTGCLTCTLKVEDVAVTLETADGVLATLSDPEADGTFEGSFRATAEIIGQPLALRLVENGQEQVFTGQSVARGPLPRLVDGKTGTPISGAEITLWRAARVIDGQMIWIREKEMNGQAVPRVSGAAGEFFFNVPPGVWRLGAVVEAGAEPRLLPPQRVFGLFPSRNVMINRPASGSSLNSLDADVVDVTMSRAGFNPPFVSVQAGDVLDLRNVSLQMRGVNNEEEGVNSGLIAPGKTFPLAFDEPGRYQLVDAQDPLNKLVVTVEPGGGTVYMPVTIRP